MTTISLEEASDTQLAAFVTGWLREHLPAGWVEAVERGDHDAVGKLKADWDQQAFDKELGEAGLNTPTWPREYFGLGLAPDKADAIERVLRKHQIPRSFDFVGKTLAGATILQWGDEEQKQKYLYGLAINRDYWCQLFSEPGSGSDLASLATRAVLDGDVWIVNGQKVWSSGAHLADYGILMARTDPDQPKHRGITYFVIDMHGPGVEVRPLKQITGGAEFNEVFFNDATVPDSERLGPVNEGWRVSTTTLMHERSGLSGAPRVGRGQVDRVIEDAKANGKWEDASVRQRLIQLLIEERVLQMTNLRSYAAREAGKPPGAEGSITKLFSSALSQRMSNAAMDVRGMDALTAFRDTVSEDDFVRYMGSTEGDVPSWAVTHMFLWSRAQTILGGTSEIQKNIIGERVLGLPKDPDQWKDQPWKEVPRS
jgi:alkylation response protein AidB-like acyl-CoA dehydrogenase